MKIDRRTKEGQQIVMDIEFNTGISKSSVVRDLKKASQLLLDPDSKERSERKECLRCYYKSVIAGQAFTDYVCKICKRALSHSDTNPPEICMECATDNKLCRCCMSKLYCEVTLGFRIY